MKNEKRNKLLLGILLVLSILLIAPGQAFADISFSVNEDFYVSDGQIKYMDAVSFVENGRIFVPVRHLAVSIGVPKENINWEPKSRSVILSKDTTTVNLILDSKTVFVNGEPILSDVSPKMVNNHVYLPARIIAEAFNFSVTWDNATQTVSLVANLPHQSQKEKGEKLSSQEIVELIQPAVVLIETQRGQGSGFFVSPDGEVVTNAHVVRGSRWINVTTTDGTIYRAAIKTISNPWDIAVLKIDSNKEFPYIEYFTKSDKISIGEDIIVFGNPLGLTGTVTKGIISAKRERSPSEAWPVTITTIQYDAPADHGSSGGPVVNMYGEWIGVNFAGYEGNDFNFAIPSEYYDYLISSDQPYNLKSDVLSYWTESREWYARLENIASLSQNINNDPNRLSGALEYQVLPQLTQLLQEVSAYEPQYQEVKKLKDMFIKALEAEISLNKYYLSASKNPYLFSKTTANELSNDAINAYDKYFTSFEAIVETLN